MPQDMRCRKVYARLRNYKRRGSIRTKRATTKVRERGNAMFPRARSARSTVCTRWRHATVDCTPAPSPPRRSVGRRGYVYCMYIKNNTSRGSGRMAKEGVTADDGGPCDSTGERRKCKLISQSVTSRARRWGIPAVAHTRTHTHTHAHTRTRTHARTTCILTQADAQNI